jgi:acetyl coenzyme A synthetase (ADP forming)-like protein
MLDLFFHPRSVAIIGASHTPGKIGYVILENFVKGEFAGEVYPVNPNTAPILDQKVYPSVRDVPGPIDLAVIAIPAPAVPPVLRECGRVGVKAVIIISGGFGEIGEKEREDEVRAICKKYKMRALGPNCMGIFDTIGHVDTLFLPRYRMRRPKKGAISFVTQSGAFGLATIDWAAMWNIGIGKFISFGNKVDVNEIDCLRYLADDVNTRCIALYVEGIEQGREFLKVAKEVTKRKPIVCLKGGVTRAGTQAVLSHTGSLAGSPEIYSAAFKQAGIIEARGVEELFDMARALAYQPLPRGDRLAIITNGGGFGVMATDSAIRYDMRMAQLARSTKKKIKRSLSPHALVGNPVDLTGDATVDMYRHVLDEVAQDRGVDGLIVICLMQVVTMTSKIISVVDEVNEKYDKPITVCMFGSDYTDLHMKMLEAEGVPTYPTPYRAVRAMAALVRYSEWLRDVS